MELYRCRICGEPGFGTELPSHCPCCGARRPYLESAIDYEPTVLGELTSKSRENLERLVELSTETTGFFRGASKVADQAEGKVLFSVLAQVEARHVTIICSLLGIEAGPPDLAEWEAMMERVESATRSVRVGIIGKYVSLPDAYLSPAGALRAGGFANDARVNIQWVTSDDCQTPEGAARQLEGVDGVLIPGGFGVRGIEGKIQAAGFAREHGIPFLGLCLGMQLLFERSSELGGADGLGFLGRSLRQVTAEPLLQSRGDLGPEGGDLVAETRKFLVVQGVAEQFPGDE